MIRFDIHHYIHFTPQHPPNREDELLNLVKQILNNTTETMSKTTDIEAKVDALQTALDNEQAQIQTAIDALSATVQELRDQIAAGQTDNDALDRIATKLDDIKSDLEGTIADGPIVPPVEPGV